MVCLLREIVDPNNSTNWGELQVSEGLTATLGLIGGGLHGEFNIGLAVDLNDPSFLNLRIVANWQGEPLAGVGGAAAAGLQSGVGWSPVATPQGFDSWASLHGEFVAGLGETVSGSVDVALTGTPQGLSFGGISGAKGGEGIGGGIFVGGGVGLNGRYATPTTGQILNYLLPPDSSSANVPEMPNQPTLVPIHRGGT